MTNLIKVSDLTHYMICPRLVYYRSRGHEEPTIAAGNERRLIEHILLKELGYNLHKLCGDDDDEIVEKERIGEEAVGQVIGEIVDGVEWIYKDELQDVGSDLFAVVKHDFLHNVGNTDWLSTLRTENGLAALERSYGYEREHTAVSEKLGMAGSVDKLIQKEEEIILCLIKTGRCPEYGVWRSDRMQLAAYAMLIEDEFETTVQRGFVEYIRAAAIREALIKKRDRALAFQILKHVRKIKGGAYPEKGANPPCDSCSFTALCETKKTLLSKLLGK